MAGALYGGLIALAFFASSRLLPQPAGSVILWSAFAVQLAWFARRCWQRTGLPFATAALADGAVMSLCLAVLATMGHPFPVLPPAAWVFVAGGAAMGPILFAIESRVHRAKWAEWERHMEHVSVWDITTGRHFPLLR